MVNKETNLNFG